ncbi:lytic murein transglycosylase [Methylobacterium nodulans]|uniref:Lytic murein transglycosylase n=1 Tax=Methylobacterium nodulans (strain LMG 21967 / CNCM I-2342 / ORS 2060) TaxID=460265 RepID=B8IFZ6_METNO|nr:lytic murein transglycosylase [Methylobacterium nodulans]ACL59706.1 lytic murein transglycosylase [Methylobacterium nodulans ORS 2060]
MLMRHSDPRRRIRRRFARAALILGLVWPGLPAHGQTAAPPDTATAVSPDEQAAFDRCKQDLAAEARARGVAQAVVASSLQDLSPDPQVLTASRQQAEFEKPLWDYIDAAVTETAIVDGRAKLGEWEPVLAAIETAYGVDRFVLAAIWGIESGYGAVLDKPTKVRPVIRSLATLACGGERAPYWRDELLAALQIADRGGIPLDQLTGSWAGAMGHTQFMPTTYLRHAVDFDGDGRRDIWHSVPDALASTANDLKAMGWRAGEGWGYEVVLPEGFDYALADEVTERPLAAWQALGVRVAGGQPPAPTPTPARLLVPAGARGPAFLLLPNFQVILRYNTALSYALAVAHLSDRLRGAGSLVQPWPRGDHMLSQDERRDLQARLSERGFDAGGIDGKIGPKTRRAIRVYQAAAGLIPDGYADAILLDRVRAGR